MGVASLSPSSWFIIATIPRDVDDFKAANWRNPVILIPALVLIALFSFRERIRRKSGTVGWNILRVFTSWLAQCFQLRDKLVGRGERAVEEAMLHFESFRLHAGKIKSSDATVSGLTTFDLASHLIYWSQFRNMWIANSSDLNLLNWIQFLGFSKLKSLNLFEIVKFRAETLQEILAACSQVAA